MLYKAATAREPRRGILNAEKSIRKKLGVAFRSMIVVAVKDRGRELAGKAENRKGRCRDERRVALAFALALLTT